MAHRAKLLRFRLFISPSHLTHGCACFVPEPGQNIHLPLPKKKASGPMPTPPLLSPCSLAIFPAAVAKVYIVSFRSIDDRRPSKFIVLADDRKEAINMAWEHGGREFQDRFDKSTGQVLEMKAGVLRIL